MVLIYIYLQFISNSSLNDLISNYSVAMLGNKLTLGIWKSYCYVITKLSFESFIFALVLFVVKSVFRKIDIITQERHFLIFTVSY